MGKATPIFAAALAALLAAGCAAPDDPLTVSGQPQGEIPEDTDLDTLTAGVLVRVAKSTLASGDMVIAASLYRRAHTMDPGNYAAAAALARTLARLGAHNEAADVFRAAIALRPKDPDILRGLGNTLVALGQPAQAIEQYERAMREREDVRLFNAIGVAYDKLNDHNMAQAYYRTGLDTAPGNLNINNNLGLSLLLSGSFGEAIKMLRKVAADPNSTARQRLNLALAFGLAGEPEAAAEVARMDLDEASVQRNIAYYETLRALDDPKATTEALRTHFNGNSGNRVRR